MAIGSSTLGLLFKIGVDVSGVKDAFKEGFGQGAQQGIKDFEKTATASFQKIGDSTKGISTGVNQAVNSLRQLSSGQVGAGVTNLGKTFASLGASLGPLGLALGGVVVAIGAAALAAYGFVKAVEAITSSAAEIGTRSKDAFEELQKNATAAGTPITELQRQLSRGIVDALDQVKGASTGFMAEVIEQSAPALIGLLKEVADWLVRLTPLAVAFGNAMAGAFNRINAGLQTFQELAPNIEKFFLHLLVPGIVTPESKRSITEFADIYAQKLKEIEDANKKFVAGPAPFDPGKIRAVKKEVDELVKALKDAQKELDKLREKTGDIIIQNMEDQLKALNQAIAATFDVQKLVDWKFAIFDYVQVLHDATDKIVADFARQAQAVPGGGGVGGIPGAPAAIPLPKPDTGGFFKDLHDSLGQSINEFQTWGDIVGGILGQFAKAGEEAFAAFILTGKFGGQIFKQLVAQIIASLAIESAIKAIFQLAEGFASLAAGDYRGAALHFSSAKIYGAVAIAAGVAGAIIGARGGLGGDTAGEAAGAGGFGGTAAPGTLTINQGAGGGQLGVLLSIDNHLSNITTAPPGDILQRGADQNPMVIGQANNEAARRDGSVSREFLQISGLRTA